jgi:hypothetical protein
VLDLLQVVLDFLIFFYKQRIREKKEGTNVAERVREEAAIETACETEEIT